MHRTLRMQAIIFADRHMAPLRMICAAPTVNPAASRLCPTFPSLLKYRAPDSHRSLCTHRPPNVMRLSLKTNRPPSKVRSHVPVDELANLAHPILGTLSFVPLAKADLLPEAASLPLHNTMTNLYRARQGRTQLLLLDEWRCLVLPPSYYTFPLSLTPHPFIGLAKFMAGRIHEMTAHPTYLPSDPSWFRLDGFTHCPRCREEEETFTQAILRCSQHATIESASSKVFLVCALNSPLWASKELLLALAAFIPATATNYPSDMFPSLPPSPASMVFPSFPTK